MPLTIRRRIAAHVRLLDALGRAVSATSAQPALHAGRERASFSKGARILSAMLYVSAVFRSSSMSYPHARGAKIGGTAVPHLRLGQMLCQQVGSPFSQSGALSNKRRSVQRRQKMRLLTHSLAAAVLTAAWSLCVPAANAQVQSPSPGLSDPSPNIPDQKLDAAAAALGQVATIKENYQQQLEAAAPSDRERIVGEANNALVKAVTDQGLSVEEYNSILVVAQNDPEVREKILQRIRPSAK